MTSRAGLFQGSWRAFRATRSVRALGGRDSEGLGGLSRPACGPRSAASSAAPPKGRSPRRGEEEAVRGPGPCGSGGLGQGRAGSWCCGRPGAAGQAWTRTRCRRPRRAARRWPCQCGRRRRPGRRRFALGPASGARPAPPDQSPVSFRRRRAHCARSPYSALCRARSDLARRSSAAPLGLARRRSRCFWASRLDSRRPVCGGLVTSCALSRACGLAFSPPAAASASPVKADPPCVSPVVPRVPRAVVRSFIGPPLADGSRISAPVEVAPPCPRSAVAADPRVSSGGSGSARPRRLCGRRRRPAGTRRVPGASARACRRRPGCRRPLRPTAAGTGSHAPRA